MDRNDCKADSGWLEYRMQYDVIKLLHKASLMDHYDAVKQTMIGFSSICQCAATMRRSAETKIRFKSHSISESLLN